MPIIRFCFEFFKQSILKYFYKISAISKSSNNRYISSAVKYIILDYHPKIQNLVSFYLNFEPSRLLPDASLKANDPVLPNAFEFAVIKCVKTIILIIYSIINNNLSDLFIFI